MKKVSFLFLSVLVFSVTLNSNAFAVQVNAGCTWSGVHCDAPTGNPPACHNATVYNVSAACDQSDVNAIGKSVCGNAATNVSSTKLLQPVKIIPGIQKQ